MKRADNEIRLLIPDDCWFDAPGQLSARFFPVFQQVASRLHEAIRVALPSLYFRDPLRYTDTKYALSMLVFQASLPFHARPRAEFSYDVLNHLHMNAFFRNARRPLYRVLADARCCTIAAELKSLPGYQQIDATYDPANSRKVIRSVRIHQMHRQPLNQMLVVEGRLLDELVKLSACGNFPPKARAKYIANFNHAWGVLLRRFCGVFDFNEAAPMLLRAATGGLRTALREFPALDRGTSFDIAA